MRTATGTLLLTFVTLAGGCGRPAAGPTAQRPPAGVAPDERPAGAAALIVGDPAPALRVAHWVNGQPVPRLEPGKVYVLDFWATWCGPCIQAMPHLAELAKRHEAAGLVVIPVTTVTGSNSRAAIDKYIAANGEKLGLTFAVCTDRRMEDSWFEAAAQDGIPCSFVVDRAGKIAFIGHPLDLDDVLPGLLAGAK